MEIIFSSFFSVALDGKGPLKLPQFVRLLVSFFVRMSVQNFFQEHYYAFFLTFALRYQIINAKN